MHAIPFSPALVPNVVAQQDYYQIIVSNKLLGLLYNKLLTRLELGFESGFILYVENDNSIGLQRSDRLIGTVYCLFSVWSNRNRGSGLCGK